MADRPLCLIYNKREGQRDCRRAACGGLARSFLERRFRAGLKPFSSRDLRWSRAPFFGTALSERAPKPLSSPGAQAPLLRALFLEWRFRASPQAALAARSAGATAQQRAEAARSRFKRANRGHLPVPRDASVADRPLCLIYNERKGQRDCRRARSFLEWRFRASP
jgi:hypothetical protein